MSAYPINSMSGYSPSLLDWLKSDESQDAELGIGMQNPTGPDQIALTDEQNLGKDLEDMKTRLKEILAQIPRGAGGKLTAKDILDYKNKKLEDFQETIKSGLSSRGVDENITFSLGLKRGTDELAVFSKHPDKKKVEAFLKERPELAEEFKNLKTLDNLTRFFGTSPASAQSSTTSSVRASIQTSFSIKAEIVETMSATSLKSLTVTSSMNMNYAQQTISTLAGVNLKV